jgi:very-short-patch-repair endonuclease
MEMHGAGGATLTRSRLEERFIELCDDHGIPRPRANQRVAGYEVDFVWREQGLIAETDGWRHHRAWSVFEADRRRDALLTVRGWTVVRVTYARLLGEPAVVAGELHALLSRRGPRRAGAGARRPPGRRPR